MVFSAMSNDYYPSLTAIISKQESFISLVNDQIETAVLLVTPAIMFLYITDTYVIKILYSNEFLPVIQILKIALFSIILKAVVWPLGFIALAKGNNKEYFKQNVFSDLLNIILTITFFTFFGLQGIGMATVLTTLFFLIYLLFFVKREYAFEFKRNVKQGIFLSLIIGIIALFTKVFIPNS